MGFWAVARHAFERGLILDPMHQGIQGKLLHLLAHIGDTAAAAELAKVVLYCDPQHELAAALLSERALDASDQCQAAIDLPALAKGKEVQPLSSQGVDMLKLQHPTWDSLLHQIVGVVTSQHAARQTETQQSGSKLPALPSRLSAALPPLLGPQQPAQLAIVPGIAALHAEAAGVPPTAASGQQVATQQPMIAAGDPGGIKPVLAPGRDVQEDHSRHTQLFMEAEEAMAARIADTGAATAGPAADEAAMGEVAGGCATAEDMGGMEKEREHGVARVRELGRAPRTRGQAGQAQGGMGERGEGRWDLLQSLASLLDAALSSLEDGQEDTTAPACVRGAVPTPGVPGYEEEVGPPAPMPPPAPRDYDPTLAEFVGQLPVGGLQLSEMVQLVVGHATYNEAAVAKLSKRGRQQLMQLMLDYEHELRLPLQSYLIAAELFVDAAAQALRREQQQQGGGGEVTATSAQLGSAARLNSSTDLHRSSQLDVGELLRGASLWLGAHRAAVAEGHEEVQGRGIVILRQGSRVAEGDAALGGTSDSTWQLAEAEHYVRYMWCRGRLHECQRGGAPEAAACYRLCTAALQNAGIASICLQHCMLDGVISPAHTAGKLEVLQLHEILGIAEQADKQGNANLVVEQLQGVLLTGNADKEQMMKQVRTGFCGWKGCMLVNLQQGQRSTHSCRMMASCRWIMGCGCAQFGCCLMLLPSPPATGCWCCDATYGCWMPCFPCCLAVSEHLVVRVERGMLFVHPLSIVNCHAAYCVPAV